MLEAAISRILRIFNGKRVALCLLFAAAWALLALSGCSALFRDKPTEQPSMEVKDESLACVSMIDDDFRAWADNEKSNLAASVDCSIKALERFKERTKGQSEDGWSRAELTGFVKTYFNADSEKWMDDALKIKQILIGGSADHLSRKEVDRVQAFLGRIKGEISRVSGRGGVVLFRAETEDVKPEDAEAASDGVEAIAEVLARELGSGDAGRAPLLLAKVEEMAEDFGGNREGVHSLVSLAESLKSIVVGGEKNSIAPSEWPRLITSTGRLWAIAIRIRYHVMRGGNDSLGAGLARSQAILEKAAQALDDSIDAQGSAGYVSNKKIADLFIELGKRKVLPRGMTVPTLLRLLPVINGKLLHGNSLDDREENSKGLGHSHVRVLREAARDWLEGQRLVAAAFDGGLERDADGLARELSRSAGPQENLLAKRARLQLLDLVERGRPLARDSEGRLLVIRRSAMPKLAKKDLDTLNLIRVGIGIVLRGYAHDKTAAHETRGLTEAEAQELYLDWRELGLELKVVDARIKTAGYRTFMEANVFTSVADGDDHISLHEGVEWLHIVLAGGQLADRIHASMVEQCGLEARDVFGRRKLKPECFRERFRADFASNFANLPGFVAWYNAPGDREERQKKVIEALETTARAMGASRFGVDSSELRGIVPVLQYAENLFAVRDVNANETLDTEELWSVFPLIHPFIRKMTRGAADQKFIHESIFSWILTFGSPPQSDAAGSAKLLGWSGAHHLVRETADRLGIIQVMSSFAVASRQERAKRVGLYLKERGPALRDELARGDGRAALEIGEIYQCQEEAIKTLGQQLQAHAQELLPREAMGADLSEIFVPAMRTVILSDPVLGVNCLPF